MHNNIKYWIQNNGTTVEKKIYILKGIIILPVVLGTVQFNIGITDNGLNTIILMNNDPFCYKIIY